MHSRISFWLDGRRTAQRPGRRNDRRASGLRRRFRYLRIDPTRRFDHAIRSIELLAQCLVRRSLGRPLFGHGLNFWLTRGLSHLHRRPRRRRVTIVHASIKARRRFEQHHRDNQGRPQAQRPEIIKHGHPIRHGVQRCSRSFRSEALWPGSRTRSCRRSSTYHRR